MAKDWIAYWMERGEATPRLCASVPLLLASLHGKLQRDALRSVTTNRRRL